MRLFRPRNLLILAIIGTVIAVVMSKKNRPADPLPTVSYSPPPAPAPAKAETSSDDGEAETSTED
jgi:hypothetical protein